jgi:hypothetical protein
VCWVIDEPLEAVRLICSAAHSSASSAAAMASIARVTMIRRSRPFARAAADGALDVDPSEEDEQNDEDDEPEDRTHEFLSVMGI